MDQDEDDNDQKSKQMALQSLVAHLGSGDNSKQEDPNPDEMDSSGASGLLASDAGLAQKMKKKGGSSGGGMGGMMGGGGGSGGGMGSFDMSSLASLFA